MSQDTSETVVDDQEVAAAGAVVEDRGEPAPTAPPPPAERPADVPEKFWDAAAGALRTDALAQGGGLARGRP